MGCQMKRSVLIAFGMLMLFSFFLMGSDCDSRPPRSAEQKDQIAVQQQQATYQRAQPIPRLDWSLERDIVIQLYKARNQRVATHTVWRGDTSVVEGHCPSIGYPIPYDTSLTNPLQPVWKYFTRQGGGSGVALEQAEPNGIFASKNSTATWVRCVVSGKEAPIYVEGKVTAYPYPIKVKDGVVTPVDGAAPSFVIKSRK